jgi:hypothetical protein
MAKCRNCGQEIGWNNFGTPENPKWVPWDDRLDQAHECPNRDGTPKKKEPAVLGVSPPREDRVVAAPTWEKAKVKMIWVRYGESWEQDGRTREHGLTVQVEIPPEWVARDTEEVHTAVQQQVRVWIEQDRDRVG